MSRIFYVTLIKRKKDTCESETECDPHYNARFQRWCIVNAHLFKGEESILRDRGRNIKRNKIVTSSAFKNTLLETMVYLYFVEVFKQYMYAMYMR